MLLTFKLGLLLGLSIIISIGAQNLFVIKQGLRNEYAFLSAWVCFFCDFILIILGVTGVSLLLIEFPVLKLMMLMGGIIFLGVYGIAAIRRGFDTASIHKNLEQLRLKQNTHISARKIILLALSFSLLNPQAILDSMVIIGGNANHYLSYEKYSFVTGAVVASFIWFMGLAIATSYFSVQLIKIKFWQALEFISGLIMLGFALKFSWQLMG